MRSIALSMRHLDARVTAIHAAIVPANDVTSDVIVLTESDMFDVRVIAPAMSHAYRAALRSIVLGRATSTSWAFRKSLAVSL